MFLGVPMALSSLFSEIWTYSVWESRIPSSSPPLPTALPSASGNSAGRQGRWDVLLCWRCIPQPPGCTPHRGWSPHQRWSHCCEWSWSDQTEGRGISQSQPRRKTPCGCQACGLADLWSATREREASQKSIPVLQKGAGDPVRSSWSATKHLCKLLSQLPTGLPASILTVKHIYSICLTCHSSTENHPVDSPFHVY